MRFLLVQLATPAGVPGGWLRFDLFAGDRFPPGVRVNAATYQGWTFEGMDRLVAWVEGEDLVVAAVHDDPSDWLGKRWARVVRFPPLFRDPAFGGAWNTRATVTVYAEGDSAVELGEFGPVLPFDDLPELEGDELRGQWLANDQFDAHRASRRAVSWREWTHGIPDEDLEEDDEGRKRVPLQRALGRYDVPKGTRTYFLRSTAEPSAGHAADFENVMIRDVPGPSDSQSVTVGGQGAIGWVWTTEAVEPGILDWPNGTYRVQLDVPAAGADLLFGFLAIGTNLGHFARVSSDTLLHRETATQLEGAFQGAGLHLATVDIDWTDFDAADRFEAALAVQRATGHGNQTMAVRFSIDCFADGPWPGGSALPPEFRLGEIASLTGRQSEIAELTTLRQSSDVEIP